MRLLRTLRARKEKEGRGLSRWHYFPIAGAIGAGCTYVASIVPDSIWTFLFGTIAIFCASFLVFGLYTIYVSQRRNRRFLKELENWIGNETIRTWRINAIRIAVAKEYEDEGDLYLVEYEPDKVLYLWDHDYNLKGKFPCLEFEIYEADYCKLIGRQVYPLSEHIKPRLVIDRKVKWKYMKEVGAPEHLSTESIDFDTLVARYNHRV